MKIVYNKIIPFGKNFYAINLFGILFAKGPCNRYIINHEKIHTAQMRELGYIPFYIVYIIEWVVRILMRVFKKEPLSKKKTILTDAYRDISFEREAYSRQYNLDYLKSRKAFSTFNYLARKE